MSVDLGRVMPIPKGEYDSTTAYERLDIVSSNGSSYICLAPNTGQPVTNTDYYMLLAQRGTNGDVSNIDDIIADLEGEISVFNYIDASDDFTPNSPTVLAGTFGIVQYSNKNGNTTHGFIGINGSFKFSATGVAAYTSFALGTLNTTKYPMPHSGTDLMPRMAIVKNNAMLLHLSAAGQLQIATQGIAIGASDTVAVNVLYAY